jgi:hypothetical protein
VTGIDLATGQRRRLSDERSLGFLVGPQAASWIPVAPAVILRSADAAFTRARRSFTQRRRRRE